MAALDDDGEFRLDLISLLRERGFGWVVEQAEAQIGEGKPVSKEVSERIVRPVQAADTFRLARPRPYRASLVTTEPFSESERLEILLKGIEAALVQRAELDEAILNKLPNAMQIVFEPDTSVDDVDGGYRGKRHQLTRDIEFDRSRVKFEMEQVLKDIRGQVRGRT